MNEHAPITLLCLKMLTGTVASSPNIVCITTQAMNVTPKHTNVTITRGLLHSYWPLPHCKARSRQIIDGMKIAVPIGSNFLNISQ